MQSVVAYKSSQSHLLQVKMILIDFIETSCSVWHGSLTCKKKEKIFD